MWLLVAPPLVIGRSLFRLAIEIKSSCGMLFRTRHLIIERVCPLESPRPQVLSLMSLARLPMARCVADVLRPRCAVIPLRISPLDGASAVPLNRKRMLWTITALLPMTIILLIIGVGVGGG